MDRSAFEFSISRATKFNQCHVKGTQGIKNEEHQSGGKRPTESQNTPRVLQENPEIRQRQ